mmetsp:Transcript_85436/g.133527  ORF Transcript_85436/g.133527 Transcript_85436/m.133527 type:complete len:244 (-) Transcript_85436:89-820(-)
MGCGASAHPPKLEDKVDDSQPADTSWAVKCQEPREGSSSSVKVAAASPVRTQQQQTVVLVDADDDDEIEIIYEQAPKQASRAATQKDEQMLVAANGQEPPEAAEEPKVQTQPVKPLSKEQQAEAAKLAERRKLFDNKRYHNEPKPTSEDNQGYPQQGYRSSNVASTVDLRPSTDIIMGLNISQQRPPQQESMFLPGGILDEVEDFRPAPLAKKKIKSHDDVESTGFDADDEALMKEILEDFDD